MKRDKYFMHTVKREQLAKVVHRTLAEIFLTESAKLWGSRFVSVTAVVLDHPCSVAKVYLSFSLHDQQETLLKQVMGYKHFIRKLLGKKIKIRKVPDLKFYIDNRVAHGTRVTALIDQLDLQ